MTQVYNDISNDAFEKIYSSIREKEKRVYTDTQVALLPLIHSGHVHYKEWRVRRRSANKLVTYLSKKKKKLSVLEVGCGNGWLSAKMASIASSHVTGIDINSIELEQAKRVFKKRKNVDFIETDLRRNDLAGKKYDVIVFAASISWFESLENIIPRALSFLTDTGEIHILDSFFYEPAAIDNARKRCEEYYISLGHPEMAATYFHHGIESLKNYQHKILYNPQGLKNKILGNADPFPWIMITNK
ncbi:MAG: class I SAM-dependent methyltransferase [Ferruginibacter sp.]